MKGIVAWGLSDPLINLTAPGWSEAMCHNEKSMRLSQLHSVYGCSKLSERSLPQGQHWFVRRKSCDGSATQATSWEAFGGRSRNRALSGPTCSETPNSMVGLQQTTNLCHDLYLPRALVWRDRALTKTSLGWISFPKAVKSVAFPQCLSWRFRHITQ